MMAKSEVYIDSLQSPRVAGNEEHQAPEAETQSPTEDGASGTQPPLPQLVRLRTGYRNALGLLDKSSSDRTGVHKTQQARIRSPQRRAKQKGTFSGEVVKRGTNWQEHEYANRVAQWTVMWRLVQHVGTKYLKDTLDSVVERKLMLLVNPLLTEHHFCAFVSGVIVGAVDATEFRIKNGYNSRPTDGNNNNNNNDPMRDLNDNTGWCHEKCLIEQSLNELVLV
jgi:hypothetical protein